LRVHPARPGPVKRDGARFAPCFPRPFFAYRVFAALWELPRAGRARLASNFRNRGSVSSTDHPSNDLANGHTVLGRLELLLNLFVALVLFALMLLRCVDVVGRYGFNAPVPGASELTGLGLALLIFGALPIITAHSAHVSVGLLEAIVGRRSRLLERTMLLVTSLLALALMAWRLWTKANTLASYGDYTSYLNVPLAPFAYFMSVMSALAVVVVLLQIVASFRAAPDLP
jgi:TRAP-type C4-dicarboxylate transport system permease small subunit